jgi:hypothetical protein
MDLSPEQAEKIARHAASNSLSTVVGQRVVAGLLRGLDDQRTLNSRLISAYAEQAQALYMTQQELAELRCPGGQGGTGGGETGSEPPPPIAPPIDAARMLAVEPGPAPRQLPTSNELFWQNERAKYVSAHQHHPEHDDSHAPMVEDGYCSACSLLLTLRTGTL